MSFAAVRKEVEGWPAEEQDRLAAYLVVLRLKRQPEHSKELGRRLDDRSPENWMCLQELKEMLHSRGTK